MSDLLFYQQARRDGGVRTGIEVDGDLILHRFDEGKSPNDPGLLWFIDVSLNGPQVPADAEAARDWLLAQKQPVVQALSEFAATFDTGVDIDALPIQTEFSTVIAGAKLQLSCSAARRGEARDLGSRIRYLARRWTSIIKSLGATQRATH
jgi:hypothetical protein